MLLFLLCLYANLTCLYLKFLTLRTHTMGIIRNFGYLSRTLFPPSYFLLFCSWFWALGFLLGYASSGFVWAALGSTFALIPVWSLAF